jgi:hypothetical protein
MQQIEVSNKKYLYSISYPHRIFVLKEAPVLVYTGLTYNIGSPRDFDKNIEDPSFFDNVFIITIPIGITTEYL